MWLASVSLHDRRGETISSNVWTPRQMRHARTLLDRVLDGAGDPSRYRVFRMCITLCMHRGIRADELELIPQWWHQADAVDIAGAPLEVLEVVGVPDIPSADPCYSPGKALFDPRRKDLWLPVDCGICPPCMARKAVRSRGPLALSGASARPR